MSTPRTLEVILRVTPELIAKGAIGDCCYCPVGLAVQAACSSARDVAVGLNIRLRLGGTWYYCPTPDDIFARMQQFDQARGMDPFEAKVTLTEMP